VTGFTVSRWIRSLQAQLFLWAVLPVTFAIISLAFTGVYAHQQAMRDFAAERDLALARLTAQIVRDGIARGDVAPDGNGLTAWMMDFAIDQPGTTVVIDHRGRALAHDDAQEVGKDLSHDQGVAVALEQQSGYTILSGEQEGPELVAFAPVTAAGWVVLVREPVSEIVGPILRLSSLAPAVAAGAGILSLLVLSFGLRFIVRPLQQLAQAAGQVYWGDQSAISQPVGGVQEIRDLHLALAGMVDRIQGYEAGMRDYLGAVTRGQEAERARLARELHDGPVQDLIALGQRAEMVQRLVGRGETERAKALLQELREAEVETVEELRRLTAALRPTYLEDLGFLPALKTLVRQADERSDAQVRLEQGSSVTRLNPEVELAAYRIAQEALNNALQHAEAAVINVRVTSDEQGLLLSVTDDGIGFTLPLRPDTLTKAGHFGLVGMQERASRAGGTLQILTEKGEGTRIVVNLPGRPAAT
jgi:signal transduction histidine kinase